MKSGIRIAIILDNPSRDLPNLVLLATELCQSGVTCFLVPHNLLYKNSGRELWSLAPDFVLLNYLRKNNIELARELHWAGIPFGILDSEAGVFSTMEEWGISFPNEQEIRNIPKFFCCWGKSLLEFASRQHWFKDSQLKLTGTPRTDFYAPPWSEVALESSLYVNHYIKNLILISGKFSFSNPQFSDLEKEARLYVKQFGWDPEVIRQKQLADQHSMYGMIDLSNRLAESFPEATFVYRPHPFEKVETYGPWLKKLPNLHLIRKGTIEGWLLRSSALIQRSCSTAIEAGFCGVPALLPEWFPSHEYVPSAESVSIPCKNFNILSEHVKNILNHSFEFPFHIKTNLKSVIDDLYYKVDGHAHKRVGEEILGCTVHRRSILSQCRELVFLKTKNSWQTRVRKELSQWVNLPLHWSFKKWKNSAQMSDLSGWDTSQKRFDSRQVESLVSQILTCRAKSQETKALTVISSQLHGDYHFGYRQGRSVTICPQ